MVVIVSILVVLDYFGVDVTALVTALGIGGLAISLAAQDTLSNMISGIMLLMDQPFRIGDRIEIQGLTTGLSTRGDVVAIGLRSTRIRTRDNRMVIVPKRPTNKKPRQLWQGFQFQSVSHTARRLAVQAPAGIYTDISDLTFLPPLLIEA